MAMGDNLSSNFEALFNKLENFVSTKTVVGEAISMGDVILLPLVDVSFGVGAAAVEVSTDKDKKGDTGGGGAGAKITPSAVIVINNGNVQLVNIKNQDTVGKLIDMAPGLLAKLNIPGFFSKAPESTEEPEHTSSEPVKAEPEKITPEVSE